VKINIFFIEFETTSNTNYGDFLSISFWRI